MGSSTIGVRVDVKGIAEVRRALNSIDKELRRKSLRKAVGAAARPIRDTAKQLAPERYGFLRRAMGIKLKTYPSGNAIAVVGAETRKVYQYQEGDKMHKAWPAKYAHLVEFGTRHSAASPFLRPAVAQHEGRVLGIMAKVLTDELRRA